MPRPHPWSVPLATLAWLLVACGTGEPGTEGAGAAADTARVYATAAEVPVTAVPERVYWGDTHVHTGWSADAGMDGAVTSPGDAYRFARGQEVTTNSGLKARLERAFDWFMVTDHSDGMGTINQVVDGNPEMMQDATLRRWRDSLQKGDAAAAAAKNELIIAQTRKQLPAAVMDPKWMQSAWEQTVAAAEEFYQPGRFTTFIAYEWTVNADGGNNLHRNVIFRDAGDRAGTMLPLTTFETEDPEKLWEWMARYESTTGGRVLAIPHNGNLSNGRMFEERRFDGSPLTRAYAEARARWEPLFEVTQIKGQSEAHPSLSPEDEFAAYDLWDRGNLAGVAKQPGMYRTEYWREALKSGLRLAGTLGANPFMYGANGATDTHTGLSTTEEDNFYGKFKTLEPRPERWNFPLLKGQSSTMMGWEQQAGSVMGVWAVANTREAIWDAMMRKETYGTTGPRILVRFFGGFDFADGDQGGDLTAAYGKGVPMGGTIGTAAAGQVPTFVVLARKDPEGANLDRVQIVKGWVDAAGKTHERIFDVAWSGDRQAGADGKLPAVGNTVDLTTGKYTNSIGAAELAGFFRDPGFDAAQRAVYYVRVLEIPTPRWTLFDKLRFNVEMDPEVPMTLQERAITSPIWYVP